MSISQKIVYSFILVIGLLMVSLVSVFIFHTSALREYKVISENLILENTLANSVSLFIEAYNAAVIAPGSAERISNYTEHRDEILDIFAQLDTRLLNEDSKLAYEGLKKITLALIDSTDAGLQEVKNGNVTSGLNTYNDAVRKKTFITENSTALILTEITHLDEIQKNIERNYNQQRLIVIIWIAAIIFITILYSLLFARMITSPIKILSRVSQKVAAGNYSQRISADLLSRNDEVGTLASSFNTMLDALNDKINQVEKAHATILAAQKDIEHRNEELEKFNTMVIGRELKMIELKEKIASYERELRSMREAKN
jgi:HAMP domain-containing protein